MRPWVKAALLAPLLASSLGLVVAGCSLGNISRTDCTADAQCAAAFGAGSRCEKGFCSERTVCTTGHDCRKAIGGGACVDGACVDKLPVLAQCDPKKWTPEPPELFSQSLFGADAPLVIGSIFGLEAPEDTNLADAVRLAVREINKDGLNDGKKLGVVFCDNGGPSDGASGDARSALDKSALAYLAGELGVPYIVGPPNSGDSITIVNELLKQHLPTAVISPSATSPVLTDIPDKLSPSDQYGLFWRTCPSDKLQAAVLANVAKADATITHVSVVYVDDAYGQGFANEFQADYGTVQATSLVPYPSTATTDPAALTKLTADIAATSPDAIVVISHSSEATIAVLRAWEGSALATKQLYLTDASQGDGLLDPTLPAWLKTMLGAVRGTAPANPTGQRYEVFKTNIKAQFGVDADKTSFLAHTYDATYVGALGVVYASKDGAPFDGVGVAAGMAHLSSGTMVDINATNWTSAKGQLVQKGEVNIEGASGHLDFDAATGEAPGDILVWGIATDLSGFTQIQVVSPP